MRISGQSILTIALIVATVLSLYFMLNTQINQAAKPSDRTPDKIISNLNFRQFDLKGQLVKHIQAAQARHIQDNNTTLLTKPFMTIKSDNGIFWHISADKSRSIHGSDMIIAQGNVVLKHKTVGNSLATTISTSWLSLNQKTHYAYTNQPVKIVRPDSTTTGLGMTANFKTGVYKVLQDAKIIYKP